MAKKPGGSSKTKMNGKNGEHKERAAKPRKTAEKLSDEQSKILMFNHKNKLRPLLDREKDAKAAVSKAYKLAEKEGVSKKMLKKSFELDTKEGRDAAGAEYAMTRMVFRWMRVKLGSQMDMFKDETPAERHFQDGKTAAQEDLPAKAPSELSQEDQQHWLAGHAEGRTSLNVQRGTDGFKQMGTVVADSLNSLAEKAGIAESLKLDPGPTEHMPA